MRTSQNIVPRDALFASGSSFCKFWFSGRQSAGDVRNSKGVSAIKNATFTDGEAWANAGYLTVGAAADDWASLAAGQGQDFNLATHTLVVSLRLKKATPAGTETFINTYDSQGGFKISAYASGQLQFAAKALDATTATINVAAATAPTLDSAEHVCTFFVGRDNASARWYVDTKSGTTSNGGIYGKDCSGGGLLMIGGSTQAGFAKTAKLATVQMYLVPKDLATMNAEQVHDYIMRYPQRPVPDILF